MRINDIEPNTPVMWDGIRCIVIGLNFWKTRVIIRTLGENEFLQGTVAPGSLTEGWPLPPKASPPPPPPPPLATERSL